MRLSTRCPFLSLLLTLALLVVATVASAQTTVTRSQVEADIAAGLTPDQIDAKYAGSVAATGTSSAELDASDAPGVLVGDAAAIVPAPITDVEIITNTGSTAYEAIKACGYHPQREELTCTIEIRQRFGFGGQICASNGSHEFVHFCVDYGLGGGLVPVNINGFHIHDEKFGVVPNWYFSAVVQSDWKLLSQLNNGRTLRARAILAWNQVLGGGANYCGLNPIWGNRADFKIRLDP